MHLFINAIVSKSLAVSAAVRLTPMLATKHLLLTVRLCSLAVRSPRAFPQALPHRSSYCAGLVFVRGLFLPAYILILL